MLSSGLQLINMCKAFPLWGYSHSYVTLYSAHLKYNIFCRKGALRKAANALQ